MQSLLKFIGFGSISQDSHPVEIQQDFIQHISSYGLSYGTAEEFAFRMDLYAQKDAKIKEINAREQNYWVAHNHMSTWTDAEYKRILGYKSQKEAEKNYVHIQTGELQDIDYVDWRVEGAVNIAKFQGLCGASWAFSATAAVEAAYYIKYGELPNMSEQQLIDCDTVSFGCKSGSQANAFKYLETHGGQTQHSYPYTSSEGREGLCEYDAKKGKTQVEKFINVPSNDVDQLRAAIMMQPVSLAIDASSTDFQHYAGGVFDNKDCGTKLDHAVAAVGFGGNNNPPNYYIIRNSWGPGWGEAGNVKISSDTPGEGICGVQKEALYPQMK